MAPPKTMTHHNPREKEKWLLRSTQYLYVRLIRADYFVAVLHAELQQEWLPVLLQEFRFCQPASFPCRVASQHEWRTWRTEPCGAALAGQNQKDKTEPPPGRGRPKAGDIICERVVMAGVPWPRLRPLGGPLSQRTHVEMMSHLRNRTMPYPSPLPPRGDIVPPAEAQPVSAAVRDARPPSLRTTAQYYFLHHASSLHLPTVSSLSLQ